MKAVDKVKDNRQDDYNDERAQFRRDCDLCLGSSASCIHT